LSKLDNITLSHYNQVYFLGIGGIGMSALAKYFISEGKEVLGYDKTPSGITDNLNALGAKIHFDDKGETVGELINKNETLVIRTPAVPVNFGELTYFQSNGYQLFKRSEVLGILTRNYKGLGVAGTHGKTTTSCLLAHVLNESPLHCNAFLGGISSNFESNFLSNPEAEFTVIEADEFDRSFLQLKPFASIITAMDPDHLDIYGTVENFNKGFNDYANLIDKDGLLVLKSGIDLKTSTNTKTYGINHSSADYNATGLRFENEKFLFDVSGPNMNWQNVHLGIPGIHNAENALSCIVLLDWLGLSEREIRHGLSTFKGVKRRFDYHINKDNFIYIDDYAHHPTEIKALLDSIELLYPNRTKIGVFQPHLFSRTRDFFDGFAEQLSRLDEVILMPIYPAREEPIPGITSDALLGKITAKHKVLLSADKVTNHIKTLDDCVLLTIGAGDIDRLVPEITKIKTEI
jgi:UDP-N-acetylmuramate--alanine ligase|tara:strand:- start:2708 stop:4090 length:1383 start_codon:yes stop_codon:yes gene_type:complete